MSQIRKEPKTKKKNTKTRRHINHVSLGLSARPRKHATFPDKPGVRTRERLHSLAHKRRTNTARHTRSSRHRADGEGGGRHFLTTTSLAEEASDSVRHPADGARTHALTRTSFAPLLATTTAAQLGAPCCARKAGRVANSSSTWPVRKGPRGPVWYYSTCVCGARTRLGLLPVLARERVRGGHAVRFVRNRSRAP